MATVRKRGNRIRSASLADMISPGSRSLKPSTGHRRTDWVRGNSKKELDRQTVLFEEKCRNRVAPSGSIKLADYIDQWFIDYAEMRLKGTTVSGYQYLRDRTIAGLGHLHLIRSHLTISMPFTII